MEKNGWDRRTTVAGIAATVAATAILVAFGLPRDPLYRLGEIDFAYLYVAGSSWRTGHDPYDYDDYRRTAATAIPSVAGRAGPALIDCSFAYAPTSAAMTIALSALGFDTARLLFLAVNVTALGIFAALMAQAARREAQPGGNDGIQAFVPWLIVAATIAAPAVARNLQMGQTTLLALALLALAWWCRDHAMPIACGCFAALASFKPSVSVFVIVALLLERNVRTIAAMTITALVLSAVPLLRLGPFPLLTDWMGAVRLYVESKQNQIGNPYSIGVSALLSAFGWKTSATPLAGLLLFVGTYLRRRNLCSVEYFGILLSLSLLFTNAHFYDFILALPLLFSLLSATCRLRSRWAGAGALALVALAILPLQLVAGLVGPSLVWRLRELAQVLICLGFIGYQRTVPSLETLTRRLA